MLETEKGITGKTSFFRDLESYCSYTDLFKELRGASRDILSLPCSTGQEPYSISLLTKDKGRFPFRVHGIDIMPRFIKVAQQGKYVCSLGTWSVLLPYFEKGWLLNGSSGSFDSIGVRVSDKIKNHMDFSVADALESRIDGHFDVIFCCNFLYLLNPDGKHRVMENMLPALKTGGFLVLDQLLTASAFKDEKYLSRHRRHSAFLSELPDKYGLEKLSGVEIYRKR